MIPDQRSAFHRSGLCGDCVHARDVTSGKGSTFLLCARHATDPTYPKYPRLPVLRCPGFEGAGGAPQGDQR